jgi:hypothetical protein
MLFALPNYRFPYHVMNRCLYLNNRSLIQVEGALPTTFISTHIIYGLHSRARWDEGVGEGLSLTGTPGRPVSSRLFPNPHLHNLPPMTKWACNLPEEREVKANQPPLLIPWNGEGPCWAPS